MSAMSAMSELEETLRQEEVRMQQQEDSNRIRAENDRKKSHEKVRELAEALKKERQVLNRLRAEVTIGHCTGAIIRGETVEDGSSITRCNVDRWVCAIRWPNDYKSTFPLIYSMDITFVNSDYYYLKAELLSSLESEEYSNDRHRLIKGWVRKSYGIGIERIGADVDAVLKRIANVFAHGWGFSGSFSGLEFASTKTIVSQGFFGRKWNL